MLAPPTFGPSAAVGPPGWVAVENSGQVLELKPEWIVPMTPDQWAMNQGAHPLARNPATRGHLCCFSRSRTHQFWGTAQAHAAKGHPYRDR
jgi:hypothetical protein